MDVFKLLEPLRLKIYLVQEARGEDDRLPIVKGDHDSDFRDLSVHKSWAEINGPWMDHASDGKPLLVF